MHLLPNPYGIKIYNVSIGKSFPQWLSEKKKKSLRYDEEYRRRMELLQDFDFPTASNRIKCSPDGEFLIATGTYPPQVKVFELSQLSMKFERHLDCEVAQFQILSEDFSKLVFLRRDRTIEFHAQFGRYYEIRIPKFGRDMFYDPISCDLLVFGTGQEIYRLNLEQGQFLSSWKTGLPGVNVGDCNSNYYFFGFGGEDGCVQCWDPRTRKRIASKDIPNDLGCSNNYIESSCEISSIKFGNDGLSLAVGTSTGHCLMYDVRASRPLFVKDHQYGYPIHNIHFHTEKRMITTDTKTSKIWNQQEPSKVLATIEPPVDINDISVINGNSGLLLMAVEQSKLLSYFIPFLGVAPKWCSFLDSLTEELEEDPQQTLYDDYKFVTREELNRLGLSKLIGTEYLKAYMHGFFLDIRLYKKFKAAIDPFEYEQYRQSRIKEQIEKQRETRIQAKKKFQLPKVNAKTALRILQTTNSLPDEEKTGNGISKSNQKSASSAAILTDPRFQNMFVNPDFEVDENDEKYKYYHPVEKKVNDDDLEDFFEAVEEDSNPDSNSGTDNDDDNYDNDNNDNNNNNNNDDEEEEEEEENIDNNRRNGSEKLSKVLQNGITRKENASKKRKVEFYELKEGHSYQRSEAGSRNREQEVPFAMRLSSIRKTDESSNVTKDNIHGSKQMSFTPKDEKAKQSKINLYREQWAERFPSRRSIKELNLPRLRLNKSRSK